MKAFAATRPAPDPHQEMPAHLSVRIWGKIFVSLFLGLTALPVCFGAAAAFETPGSTSNGELIAPCIAAVLYLAFCQFWVAPRGNSGFWTKWSIVIALVVPSLLNISLPPRTWGIPWVLVSGSLGSVIGAMIAQRVISIPREGTPTDDSRNRGRNCRRNLLAGFMLLVAVALLISIGVILLVLADSAANFNARSVGVFLGATVVFVLLVDGLLASAVWRCREHDRSSKGTLGITAFLALLLSLVYCAFGILASGHGPALRVASVLLILSAVFGLITTALMTVTSVIVDRARLSGWQP